MLSKIENKTKKPTLTILFQHGFGSFNQERRKENIKYTDWKGKN